MGSSSSKVAKEAVKKFPTSPTASGPGSVQFKPVPTSFPARPTVPSRPPGEVELPPTAPYEPASTSSEADAPPLDRLGSSPASPHHGAAEHKTQEIQRDGSDPAWLAQLSQLGQVKTPFDPAYRPPPPGSSPYNPLFATRASDPVSFPTRDEPLPTNNLHNRLTSAALAELLYKRHHVRKGADVMALAAEYDIDVEVLEQDLGLWVSPVRPEWGVELQSRVIDHSLDQEMGTEKYIPWGHQDMGEDRLRERGKERRSVGQGKEMMQMGSTKGRAPAAGKLDAEGNQLFDVDANRVLARWRDPILPLGITQARRDQLEAEKAARDEAATEARRIREQQEAEAKQVRAQSAQKRIGEADI